MPFYVLLVLDDEEQAKDFVAATLAENAVEVPQTYPDMMNMYPATVWGVWAKPTEFCECPQVGHSGFTRESDYGWWVHAACGKPTARWAAGGQWFGVLGTTLLPREFQPIPSEVSSPKEWRDIIDDTGEPSMDFVPERTKFRKGE